MVNVIQFQIIILPKKITSTQTQLLLKILFIIYDALMSDYSFSYAVTCQPLYPSRYIQ